MRHKDVGRKRRHLWSKRSHKQSWPCAIALVYASLLLPPKPGVAQAAIPALRGVALNGDPVRLPEALKGKVGVLVLGFSQSARGQVTAWATKIAADYRDVSGVAYYELPMMGSVPRVLRGLVLRKISSDVPERAKRRFLPVYDHEPEWRAAARFGRAEDAYVLVVDENGVVRYNTQGDASERAYAEVKKRVEGMR